LEELRSNIGSETIKNATMEVSMVEDDPGSGHMLECLTLKCSRTMEPGRYDSIQGSIVWNYTTEIFAESENRVPRMTSTSCRDLKKREE